MLPSRLPLRSTAPGALVVALLVALVWAPGALATPGGGNGAATITGSFADSCRDFQAHSSKDISHVELRYYADGRVVKDESIDSPDYTVDGGVGHEIHSAVVKSGTTTEPFACPRSSSPPVAVLELLVPPSCGTLSDGTLVCNASAERTVWSRSSIGFVSLGCPHYPPDPSGVDPSLCSNTVTFRGTSSTDPDNDIVSWSIDFHDGTVVSGSWTASPPTAVAHTYPPFGIFPAPERKATLTVTDSAGQTSSDTMLLRFDVPD